MNSTPLFVSSAWFIAFYILSLVALALVLLFALRLAHRAWRDGLALGVHAAVQLAAVLLALLWFPQVLPAVIDFLGSLARGWTQALQEDVWRFAATVPPTMDSQPGTVTNFIQVSRVFGQVWVELVSTLRNTLLGLPLVQVFQCLATIMLLAHGLTAVMFPDSWLGKKSRDFSRNEVLRNNTFFFALLIVGVFFCTAAITTLPTLTETVAESEQASAEAELKQQLEGIERAKPAFVSKLAQGDPVDALEKFLAVRKTPEAAKPESGKGEPNRTEPDRPAAGRTEANDAQARLIGQVNFYVGPIRTARNDVRDYYLNLVTESSLTRSMQLTKVLGDFRINNRGRIGRRESARYLASCVNWFQSQLEYMQFELSRYELRVKKGDAVLNEALESLQQVVGPGATADPREGFAAISKFEAALRLYRSLEESSFSRDEYRLDLPQRPELGDNLGAFRLVASWLLKTESLPLALIVGMIGFGLLGSACTTFIRERGQHRNGDPLVKDLIGVILRGVSAAVVVFLAAEGGLAIFSTSVNSTPNPYVLLLTCLIAAVYSEVVWEKARVYLTSAGAGGPPQPLVNTPPPPGPGANTPPPPDTLQPHPFVVP